MKNIMFFLSVLCNVIYTTEEKNINTGNKIIAIIFDRYNNFKKSINNACFKFKKKLGRDASYEITLIDLDKTKNNEKQSHDNYNNFNKSSKKYLWQKLLRINKKDLETMAIPDCDVRPGATKKDKSIITLFMKVRFGINNIKICKMHKGGSVNISQDSDIINIIVYYEDRKYEYYLHLLNKNFILYSELNFFKNNNHDRWMRFDYYTKPIPLLPYRLDVDSITSCNVNYDKGIIIFEIGHIA